MAVRKTVRIYDLAKELKQDTKRVMEELRRAGADVSVASNSVPVEFADKLRNKYIAKAEAPVKPRAIKVIKAAKKEEAPTLEELAAPVVEAEVETQPAEPVAAPAEPVEVPEPVVEPQKTKVLKPKAKPAPEPEVIALEDRTAREIPVEIPSEPVESQVPESAKTPEPAVTVPITPPGGRTVKILRPTSEAVQKGIKAGDASIASQTPRKTGTLSQAGVGRPQFQGTPGERTAPQMTYIPPADNRRRPGRSGGRKTRDDKNAKFAERDIEVPRQTTIEERVMQQVGSVDREHLKSIRLTEGATIREFAEALGITPRDIVQLLIKRGVFATLNQPIGEKMALEMGTDFGFDVSFVPFEEMVIEQEFEELIAADADDVELPRAPVVTVMGHVDHGKTSLLDGIRQANVAEGEAGGITQHIGAYSVFVPNPDTPEEQRRVVFLDTPGHEAFTMMRARGAKATDIVILVVAADDGVMPQTVEAVEHSKAANVPIIVAINKIDKPDANPDKVKQGLANLGLQPVDWGGDIEMVPVSAKRREGLDTLLETVLLQADILDLKASPTRRASGVVLEAKLDKGRGAVATALVQQGTLRTGDPFIVGQFYGKVRAMFSDRGEPVSEASPATPVEVLGLQGVPQAGDTFQVVADVERAQDIANQRQMVARQAQMVKSTKRGIESLGQAEVKELLVILKADVQGSVEVLRGTLEKLSTEKVKVKVVRAGVGAINESDVLLASATQADSQSTAVVIIGFNVRPEARASEVAKHEDVDIRLHSIIYKV
ncbi:MAG TPA: translation initiation factor IF-2, partial [Pyrinomonadaceae bacterium]|nr:translation initiation factor IF-2 [Pyrinomonadaceae bacterium]